MKHAMKSMASAKLSGILGKSNHAALLHRYSLKFYARSMQSSHGPRIIAFVSCDGIIEMSIRVRDGWRLSGCSFEGLSEDNILALRVSSSTMPRYVALLPARIE
jgi:hypothetical protein